MTAGGLPTAEIHIVNSQGKSTMLGALIDQGSMDSYISEQAVHPENLFNLQLLALAEECIWLKVKRLLSFLLSLIRNAFLRSRLRIYRTLVLTHYLDSRSKMISTTNSRWMDFIWSFTSMAVK